MNKVISLLAFFALLTPAFAVDAGEYKTETFEKYGYASAASTITGSGLKGGLRGSHVASNHHRENSYYPGYTVIPANK